MYEVLVLRQFMPLQHAAQYDTKLRVLQHTDTVNTPTNTHRNTHSALCVKKMPWFGLSRDVEDDDLDAEDEGERILNDLEAGGPLSLQTDCDSTYPYPLPAVNPSSNASSSSGGSDELAAIVTDIGDAPIDETPITEKISFRALQPGDRGRIEQLHTAWFPVTYSDEFYDELVTNQRLATSGDNLFTCVATMEQRNLYCQSAGEGNMPQPHQQQDEIIGCIVGAFLHPSRLNFETAEMLVPNPQVHSKLFYIMTLGTVQEYRNLGLATSLIQQTMDLIENDPTCGALYLHVIPFNHAAIRFYEKLGFYRVCTIENYYNIEDKHYDCFLYAKYFHGESMLMRRGRAESKPLFLCYCISIFRFSLQEIVAIGHCTNSFREQSRLFRRLFGNIYGLLSPFSPANEKCNIETTPEEKDYRNSNVYYTNHPTIWSDD